MVHKINTNGIFVGRNGTRLGSKQTRSHHSPLKYGTNKKGNQMFRCVDQCSICISSFKNEQIMKYVLEEV